MQPYLLRPDAPTAPEPGSTRAPLGLLAAGGLLVLSALFNIVAGAWTLLDPPRYLDAGLIPASPTYWGLSSIVFGALEATAAALLIQQKRTGAAIGLATSALGFTYWVTTATHWPVLAGIAIVALLAIAGLVVVNRARLR
jgi:hypothetical protein